MHRIVWPVTLALSLWIGALPALAAITFERVTNDDEFRLLVIQGDFEFDDDERSLLEEVAAFRPSAVTFDSGGGNVDAAMRFGRTIRRLDLSTMQLRALECASACTLAFLGGSTRFAEPGAIGVHRSSFSGSERWAAEEAVSEIQQITGEIMTYMIEMGVDPALLQLALSVDRSDMRYLTAAEMRQYRVTTEQADKMAGAEPMAPSRSYAPSTRSPAPLPDVTDAAPEVKPSRPNRVALYTGLDFLGSDIRALEVADAASCAVECLSDGVCRAFTFNVKTRPGRGPNCFLKRDQGQYDGNSAAVSGVLLTRSDPEPQTMHFGVIDPLTHLYKNLDVPGFDLSRRPHPGATTSFACRIACVNERQCAAFTFLNTRKECWLKSGIGQSRTLAGAVTGAKVPMTFTPESISLD
jgi:hypothetical protein